MSDPKPLDSPAPQTSDVRPEVGALVPGPRGGKLRVGNPGNRGGLGATPSELRARLRGTFAERVEVLERIADGTPTVRTRVALKDLLPHVACPNCGETGLVARQGHESVEVEGLQSASNRDRLGALELAAKYGLGQLREVSTENVRERVKQTLEVIRQTCPEDLATRVILAMRPIWTDK